MTDHYAEIVRGLPAPPVIIGHSFGGLITEKLLGQGYGAAGVAIDPAQIKGVLPLPLAQLRSGLPALGNPANLHRTVELTEQEFRFGFGNALTEEESAQLFETCAIPSPARPLFQAAAANFVLHSQAAVDTDNQTRGPLLLISGTADHTVPDVVTRSTFKQYRDSMAITHIKKFEGRGHSLTIDNGWQDVANVVLDWLKNCGSDAMKLDLDGRIAIVTGASRGIGLAITRTLAAEGAHVIAGARRPTDALTALTDAGGVEFVAVDLAAAGAPEKLLAVALAHGGVDVLVNNVGAATPRLNGFLTVTDEQWLTALTLNLMAAVRTTRAVLPTMLAAGHGSIVSTGSVNAFLPDPTVIDYSAAKAALTNLSKALSKEVGPKGIRVNTVSPGPVETDLWLGVDGVAATIAEATGADPAAIASRAAADSVTGRFTRP
ncbi:MAG TPA: SDR family NAD(P)-dependent oxidoreductase, partial [Nakamurella sp.]